MSKPRLRQLSPVEGCPRWVLHDGERKVAFLVHRLDVSRLGMAKAFAYSLTKAARRIGAFGL